MIGLQQVDRLDIQVLVDNITDSLSSTPAFVTREWVTLRRQGMRITAGGSLCCANHGLALVITAHGPSGARTLLFDGGPVDDAVERNGVRLGIDFGGIGAVMLSHGHWDHAGGIPRALGMIGQVCRPDDDAPWQPDPLLMDERFLAIHVRGKGMVVFSACSDAGIVNVMHHVHSTFPDVHLHTVMGGFHLSGPTEAIIPETVRDLGTFGLDLMIPAHCTGWRALNALERAYGEKVVVPSAVGKRFNL